MSSPRGDSYQAEVLRFIHDDHKGILIDNEVGVTRRIWDALGQTAGKNFPSVCATLSALEARGCVLTDFAGRPNAGGRMRVSVMIVEEPPEGHTQYRERAVRGTATDPHAVDVDLTHYPTPEEVARELLRLTVEAAGLPATDIRAAHHHIECLQEEIAGYVEMVDELESSLVVAGGRRGERAEQAIRLLLEQRRRYAVLWKQLEYQVAETIKGNRHIEQLLALNNELHDVNDALGKTIHERDRTINVLEGAIRSRGTRPDLPGEQELLDGLHRVVEQLSGTRIVRGPSRLAAVLEADA